MLNNINILDNGISYSFYCSLLTNIFESGLKTYSNFYKIVKNNKSFDLIKNQYNIINEFITESLVGYSDNRLNCFFYNENKIACCFTDENLYKEFDIFIKRNFENDDNLKARWQDAYEEQITINLDHLPLQEFYPWLKKDLKDYYQGFQESSANILLLIGKPGTGKTTFLKGLIKHFNTNVWLSYNTNKLSEDYIYQKYFLDSYSNLFIFEDADNFLKPRMEGNEIVHKFLNLGDGIISNKSKKFIFTTNLESIDDIEKALVRTGRCYDVLEFRELTFEESLKINKNLENNLKSYKLSDIFNGERNFKKPQIGFY